MRLRLPGFITKDILAMAFDSIRAHKFRSTLTVLGIIIGVLTVIVVAALLTGLRGSLVKIVEEYGANNIYAFHLTTGIQVGERAQGERARKPLTPEDGAAIRTQAPAVADVAIIAPNIGGWGSGFDDTIITDNGKTYRRGNTQGITPNYAEITNVRLKEGRFINEQDDAYRRNALVLGVNAAEALFPDRPGHVVGAHVKMGGYVWEVVGTLEKRKSTFLGENDEDNAVFVPFRTSVQVAPARRFVLLIVQAKSGLRQEAFDQTEELLRTRRAVRFDAPDDFDLKTADSFVGQFDSIFGMVGLIAIAFSGIGLLVGGIGVMNIMLVSVTERTQEIGVRKAVGARRRDIVSQFLYEAMTLTLFGGLLGVLLSFGVSQLVMLFVPTLPATVPAWAVVAGLLVSVCIGLVFGVWPAMKAARLDPIECLRYE